MPSKVAEAYILLRATTDQLVADITAARGKVAAMVPSLAGVWQTAWAGLSKIGDVLGQPFQEGLAFIIGSVRTVAKITATTLGTGFEVASRLAYGALSGIAGILNAVGDAAKGIFSLLTGNVIGLVSGVLGALGSLGTAVLGMAKGILGAVLSLVKGSLNVIQTVLQGASTLFAKALGVALDMAASIIKPTMQALSQNLFDFDPAIQLAMAAETRGAKMAAVILGTGQAAGWSSEQLHAMRDDILALGGQTIASIEEAQLALLRFGQVRGTEFKDALNAARQISAYSGQSLSSVARQLGQALENPTRAMRVLRSAGMMLSPATEQLVKMRMASGDLAGAQNAVLQSVGRYGDVAGAVANTVSGKLQILKANWELVSQSIGEALLPLVDIVARFTTPLVQGISESLRAFFGGVALDSQNLVANAKKWIDDNKDQIVAWGRMIGDTVAGVVQFVRNLFQWMGQGIVNIFHWMTGSTGVDMNNVQDAVTSGLAVIETAVQNLPLVWQIAWTGIKLGWATLIDAIKRMWEEFKVWIIAHIKTTAVAINDALTPSFMETPLTDYMRSWSQGVQLDMQRDLRQIQRDWKPDEQIAALRGELEKATNEFAAKAQANIAKSKQTPTIPGRGPRPDMTPTPLPLETTMKFQFSGFADMWKKTQESLTGGSMVQLAKATADNTGRAATAAEQTRDAVVALGGQLKNVNPGLA